MDGSRDVRWHSGLGSVMEDGIEGWTSKQINQRTLTGRSASPCPTKQRAASRR